MNQFIRQLRPFTVRRLFLCLLLPALFFTSPGTATSKSLTVLTSFSEAPVKALVDDFVKQNPDVNVEIIYRRTLPALRVLDHNRGMPVDVMMSSSPTFFNTLDKAGQLAPLPNLAMTPEWLQPHTLGLSKQVATIGYSGVGIMFNRRYLEKYNLPEPQHWQDLASPVWMGHVMMSAPSQSGTTHMMLENILQTFGWQKGWALIMQIGGNISSITARSFGVSEGVTRGLAAAGLVVDSYAYNSQSRFSYIGFNYIPDSIILPTYFAISRATKNRTTAESFIHYLLSPAGQKIISTKEMRKMALTEPALAQQHDFVTDQQLLFSREHVVNALFDQAITQQLPKLRMAWATIYQAEEIAKKNPANWRIDLITKAREKASQIPLDEAAAAKTNLLNNFSNIHDHQHLNPDAEKTMYQWRKQVEENLNQAITFANQAMKSQ